MSSTAPTPKRASRRRDHASTTEGGQLQHAPQQQDHHDKARPDAFAPAQPTPGNDETASLPDPEDVAPKDRLSVVRALADDRGVLLEGYLRQRTRHSLLKKWKRRYFVINVATRELRYYMSMVRSTCCLRAPPGAAVAALTWPALRNRHRLATCTWTSEAPCRCT